MRLDLEELGTLAAEHGPRAYELYESEVSPLLEAIKTARSSGDCLQVSRRVAALGQRVKR